MNRDTLYAANIVDTAGGATITILPMPDMRYFPVLLIDNDHYCAGVIHTSGVHDLPADTRYIAALVRIQVLRPDDPADVALVNALQDQFLITAASAEAMPQPRRDGTSLAALSAQYNTEFGTYSQYPAGFMGSRGRADEAVRHLALAGAWGLFPNRDAIHNNYNAGLPAAGGYTATYQVPENDAF